MSPSEREKSATPGYTDLYVPAFDGIRGLVSVTIALVHIQLLVGWFPHHHVWQSYRVSAFFSIEFLFLLGGFVAMMPVAYYGRFNGVRSYALRRAGRILPLYLLTLVLAVILGSWLREVNGTETWPHDLEAVLVHIAFLQQFIYPFQTGFGVQAIVWTMTVVLCFYVCFPLIVRGFLKQPLVGLGLAVALTVGWRLATADDYSMYVQPPLFAADFGIGMAAAIVYIRLAKGEWQSPKARPALAICGGALVAMLAMMYLAGAQVGELVRNQAPDWWQESTLLALLVPAAFATVLVSINFTPSWFRWPLANRVARFVGQNAQGLFLFHWLVILSVAGLTDIARNGSPTSVIQLTALGLPLSIFVGWLGTRYVENPIRLRAQRLAARPRSTAPKSTPAPLPATAE